MKTFFILAVAFITFSRTSAQIPEEAAIISILDQQISSWNEGNLEKFMQGYWKNDSLTFISKNGVTYGYDNALANYKKSYPDTAAMGRLSFSIIQIKKLSADYYFVIGRYQLNRTVGDADGHYTLLFRKINGRWKIVSDHSS